MEQPDRTESSNQGQPFDILFKEIVEQHVHDILPVFLPGAVYEETLDTERMRPPQRVDKVFKGRYRGELCILHIEFQASSGRKMKTRLLVYNTMLYQDHGLPVITMVIYLFRATMVKSPFVIKVGTQTIITFQFLVLPMFELDAEQYVHNHVTSMYPLLPTMQGVNKALIRQVVAELIELYKEDKVTLAQQIMWLEILLERTDTIASLEKQEIGEELKMYDRLWEESSLVRKIRAEGEAKGEARGEVKGELQGLRQMIMYIIEGRFPALNTLAQNRIAQITDLEELKRIGKQLAATLDEEVARRMLTNVVA